MCELIFWPILILTRIKFEIVCVIMQSVLGHVHSLCQSKYCNQCHLVFPLSISSILSLPVAAYVFVVLQSLLPILQQRVLEGIFYARCD